MNYYQILEIKFDATQEEIKQAYRKQAKKWHPDINQSPEAHVKMIAINQAYEILSDLEQRKQYDDLLRVRQKNSIAYSTYTKTRKESESDLDDWLKAYLKQRRIIEEIYEKYATIVARIIWLKNNNFDDDEELKRKLSIMRTSEKDLEQYYSREYDFSNDKDSITALEYLFSNIEKSSMRAFDINTGYRILPAKDKEKILYGLHKNEFKKTIEVVFTRNAKLVCDFLYQKEKDYVTKINSDYEYAIPANVKDIEKFLRSVISKLKNDIVR